MFKSTCNFLPEKQIKPDVKIIMHSSKGLNTQSIFYYFVIQSVKYNENKTNNLTPRSQQSTRVSASQSHSWEVYQVDYSTTQMHSWTEPGSCTAALRRPGLENLEQSSKMHEDLQQGWMQAKWSQATSKVV